mmetsp:Transcript_129117/g.373710  ORF Transcript_129117/g.373710 Transcript_129117/m.373710 type:complete len:236 (-) Transcript_129117:234-941(-)
MPALRQSGPPLFTSPRCWAYIAQSNIGDHGRGALSSASPTSLRSRASTPLSRSSTTCAIDAGFKFSISGSGFSECSMTHRNAEKGSRTWASGMSIPTICTSRGTSSRGKTTPGLSQRHVRSSRMSVCKVFVWPGVAFTLTTLPPIMLFTNEDLPTFGCPMRPNSKRPAATPCPGSAQSGVAARMVPASSVGTTGASGSPADRLHAPGATRWHSSMRAARPIGRSRWAPGGKDSFE